MKAIWILLTILGVLGILMGCVMYGDIGIACFVCALSALLSGIGFAIACRKIRSRGYLQPSDVQAKEGLGEGTARPSRKKYWYGCATAISVVIVLFVCVATFSSGGGRRPSIEEASAAELAEEVKLGEQVLAWLKTARELRGPQRSEALSRFEGKRIIMQGIVEEFNFSDIFDVVLKVGVKKEDRVKFEVASSALQETKTSCAGQLAVMYGRVTRRKESLGVSLVCDNAEIVPETKYRERQP